MTGWYEASPFSAIPGAVLGALVAGALLPLLGTWVVLQRVVFLGVALAQVAAAGVALGLLLGLPPLPLGLALALGLVLAFAPRPLAGTRPARDAALGAAFCLASALALLFISRSPADLDQVNHVLHGNLIYATGGQVAWFGTGLLAAAALVGLAFHRMLFAAFDAESAAALGLRPRAWLLLLFGVLAVVLTLSMRTTGALLSFALLVLPPLAALRLRRGLRATFLLASALGLLAAAAGLLLAVTADLHLESSIVVAAFLLLPLAWAWTVWPPLAIAGAIGLGALAPLLAPEDVAPPGARHSHEALGALGGEGALLATAPAARRPPLTLDVHLHARRAEGALEVEWTLDLHRDDPRASLPPAVWLHLSAAGAAPDAGGGGTEAGGRAPGPAASFERPLVEDAAALAPGDHFLRGRFILPDAPGAGELHGSLWSGPLSDPASLPIESANVADAAIE